LAFRSYCGDLHSIENDAPGGGHGQRTGGDGAVPDRVHVRIGDFASNPESCHLLGIAVDDMCLPAVCDAAGDPAICDRLYPEGIRPTCRAYYADPERAPRLLTPTP
jgi:hypothetical protein